MKKHLKTKFPDVCEQVFELNRVYSRADIEDTVVQFSKAYKHRVIAYQSDFGRVIYAYTSGIFTEKLDSFKKNDKVIDPNTGETGVIVSDEPFFCCCTLSVRVAFGDKSDVYDCSYFM